MPSIVRAVDVYAGDTLTFPTFRFLTGDVPVDLSGWTFAAMWRSSRRSTNSLPLTVDTTDAATGTIRISATPAQTAAMAGPGFWDLEGTQGGVVRTWLDGETTWRLDITRD